LAQPASLLLYCLWTGLFIAGEREVKPMATVRISGNWRNPNKKEWAGAPVLDSAGRIERTISIPEAAYQAIEQDIEGITYLEDGTRFDWFVDR
jgi:hypothetical protein